jgi:hypothetical protein
MFEVLDWLELELEPTMDSVVEPASVLELVIGPVEEENSVVLCSARVELCSRVVLVWAAELALTLSELVGKALELPEVDSSFVLVVLGSSVGLLVPVTEVDCSVFELVDSLVDPADVEKPVLVDSTVPAVDSKELEALELISVGLWVELNLLDPVENDVEPVCVEEPASVVLDASSCVLDWGVDEALWLLELEIVEEPRVVLDFSLISVAVALVEITFSVVDSPVDEILPTELAISKVLVLVGKLVDDASGWLAVELWPSIVLADDPLVSVLDSGPDELEMRPDVLVTDSLVVWIELDGSSLVLLVGASVDEIGPSVPLVVWMLSDELTVELPIPVDDSWFKLVELGTRDVDADELDSKWLLVEDEISLVLEIGFSLLPLVVASDVPEVLANFVEAEPVVNSWLDELVSTVVS